MPPWLRLLPRPNADCLFPPSVNSILRRTSIRWRGQRRACSADPDWFISAIPLHSPCRIIRPRSPALAEAAVNLPSHTGTRAIERFSRICSFLTCAGGIQLSFHLPDHGLPHVDLELELMLERRLRGIDEGEIQLHLLHQGLHPLKIVPQRLNVSLANRGLRRLGRDGFFFRPGIGQTGAKRQEKNNGSGKAHGILLECGGHEGNRNKHEPLSFFLSKTNLLRRYPRPVL